MPLCLQPKLCLPKYVHLPGVLEACLHCLYTGFFVIEAATYGLILEQKFHGVLQIVLINFYLVLLCLVFIRWNMDMNSSVCHLLISILSFILTLFVGKLILMYIDFMERPLRSKTKVKGHSFPTDLYNNHTGIHQEQPLNENLEEREFSHSGTPLEDEDDNFPKKVLVSKIMKLDPLIVILDISVYLLISISYIVMLLKISCRLRNNFKLSLNGGLPPPPPHQPGQRMIYPPSFYEINSSETSIVSSGLTTP